MKKTSITICLLAVLFLVNASHAELVDNGDGTITDMDRNLMWLQNANLSGNTMTWNNAMTWASDLVFADYDDWRLPSAYNSDGSGPCGFGSYNCNDSEMGHLYYTELGNSAYGPLTNTGPFLNLDNPPVDNPAYGFWYQDTYKPQPIFAWSFAFENGYQNVNSKTGVVFNAWAVRVVPEPISSTLFIVGGATLGMRRFRKRGFKR